MNQKTLKLTTGAMFMAIFGVLLLINRQTGYFLEELLFYVLPIPMVAYAAMYGWKNGLPVMIGMCLLSLFLGSVTTVFYAITQSLLGLVFGTCLNRKADPTRTMFLVMGLSALFCVLNLVVLASLFGYDLETEITELQTMMDTTFSAMGISGYESLYDHNYLMQMFVIASMIMGLLQGYIVYVGSLLILRRLKFPVQNPRSAYYFFPPKWTGMIAVSLVMIYTFCGASFDQMGTAGMILRVCGICATYYLIAFGIIGILFYLRTRQVRPVLGILAVIVTYFFLFYGVLAAGAVYIISDYHEKLLNRSAVPLTEGGNNEKQ